MDEIIHEIDVDTEKDGSTPPSIPPPLPDALSQDERYFALLSAALRKCLVYKPKFGQSRGDGLTLTAFQEMYGADPFYAWLGIDSPLMYAAHKAAGGMTSIYRQIGIGSQWIFFQMLQDCLGITAKQAVWSYAVEATSSQKERTLTLDGRIALDDIASEQAKQRIRQWINTVGSEIGLPQDTIVNLNGVVFEVRQGYKSKDSKRQNADIANAAKAYAHLYIPVILLFSTQIDADVAHRYKENLWLLLAGRTNGPATSSTYTFCREIIGYDLSDFFQRYSPRIKSEVETVLSTLLSP